MIMHDINMALYYSDKFVFMKNGHVVNCGDKNIVTPELVKEIYGIESKIIYNSGMPFVVPKKSDFNNAEQLDEIDWIKKK